MNLPYLRTFGSREATFFIAHGERESTVRGRLLAISDDEVTIVRYDHKRGDQPIRLRLSDVVRVEAIEADD